MSDERPNIFSEFATSELSQDAAVCWAIAWADSKYATADPALHAIGRDLIASMFHAAGIEAPEGSYPVKIKRQLDHLDIVVELGSGHLLAIEDKVHASEHSEQLRRYAEALARRYPDRSRALIFLKTGDQSSYRAVEADGWALFLRRHLLDVLRRGGGCTNAILRDFVDSLETMDSAVQRYKTAPVAEWAPGDPAYTGLYLELQAQLGDGNWNYVPNKSGGFRGFWWNFHAIKDGELYLQLEESTLVAKLRVKKPSQRRELRKKWFHRVVNAIPGLARPAKFGSGECMTVAIRSDYRVSNSADGRLDLAATVELLRRTTAALSQLVARVG